MKGGQEVQHNFATGFSEKKIQGKWVILGLKIMHWLQVSKDPL